MDSMWHIDAKFSITLILLILAFFPATHPRHIHSAHVRHRRRVEPVSYLQKLGYLPGSDAETAAIRTQEELSKAIKKFQKFANVEETGKLDDATIKMMKKSRCGVADVLEPQSMTSGNVPSSTDANNPPLGFNIGPSKWQKRWITYRLLNYSGDLSKEKTKEAISNAFKIWSDTANLKFEEKETGFADIYILFAREYHQDGYPFDKKGGTLAHAFFPGEGKGGDVHFDDDELWTMDTANGTNLYIVGAHEIGHALGLGHSHHQGSLMFPWYKGYTEDLRLDYDDIYAIQTVYGPRIRDNQHTTPASKFTVPTISTTTITTTRRHDAESPTTRYHHHHVTPPKSPLDPEDCNVSVDAVSRIRSEYFFFKDHKFYRLNKNRELTSKPIETQRFWYHMTHKVDAVFEDNDFAYFFSGKRYWKYFGNRVAHSFPQGGRPITDFGLPPSLEYIDAAFRWKHNGRLYLISGDMYWRLNKKGDKVDYGYPRDMSMWGGVKLPVDSAFTDHNGVTYFFHKSYYWAFNNARMQVRPQKHHISHHFFNCSIYKLKESSPHLLINTISSEGSSSSTLYSSFIVSLFSLLVVLFLNSKLSFVF